MQSLRSIDQFNQQQRLAVVDLSPAAVASHDKAGWLALFARYNVVEDPVGSTPHIGGTYDAHSGRRGNGALGRFYETFIAPNAIRFHVETDCVCDLHVMRDLTIEITMSPDVVVQVPVHLLYELTVENGELKVFRLAAHWELWPMLQQQMASGLPFLRVGTASALRLVRHLGLSGMWGFMRALFSVGSRGKGRIMAFSRYFAAADAGGLEKLFACADTTVAFPYGAAQCSIAELAQAGGAMRFSKILAAGNVVSASVEYERGQAPQRGVAVFELDRRSLQIVTLTFYGCGPVA